ncbi:MAG: TlpA family protein disulfide reductase [Dehalococcoidia bacterium]|nr:MAG: TlpA family protein disulfide reductase [Dehalococcoidia bacterium]
MGIWLRRSTSRFLWPALVLLAVALSLMAAPSCTPSPPDTGNDQRPEVGNLAPDFTLTDLDGNSVTLSHFRGKVIFLNFWASWCPPCRAEMPDMEAIYQNYKDQDVVVIGVNVNEAENAVRQFVQQGGYSWTFVIDTTGEVTRSYGATAIPASFFIDREGIIRAVSIGSMSQEVMASHLAEAMG